jgi:hypothetical protein
VRARKWVPKVPPSAWSGTYIFRWSASCAGSPSVGPFLGVDVFDLFFPLFFVFFGILGVVIGIFVGSGDGTTSDILGWTWFFGRTYFGVGLVVIFGVSIRRTSPRRRSSERSCYRGYQAAPQARRDSNVRVVEAVVNSRVIDVMGSSPWRGSHYGAGYRGYTETAPRTRVTYRCYGGTVVGRFVVSRRVFFFIVIIGFIDLVFGVLRLFIRVVLFVFTAFSVGFLLVITFVLVIVLFGVVSVVVPLFGFVRFNIVGFVHGVVCVGVLCGDAGDERAHEERGYDGGGECCLTHTKTVVSGDTLPPTVVKINSADLDSFLRPNQRLKRS